MIIIWPFMIVSLISSILFPDLSWNARYSLSDVILTRSMKVVSASSSFMLLPISEVSADMNGTCSVGRRSASF